jgi:hypothetical protein
MVGGQDIPSSLQGSCSRCNITTRGILLLLLHSLDHGAIVQKNTHNVIKGESCGANTEL